jgi:small conductance mechanosensitive channel
MKPTPAVTGILLIAMALMSGLSQPVGAQQEAPQPATGDNELAVEASEILQSIDEREQELHRLQSEIEAASGVDKGALLIRGVDLLLEMVDEIWKLADNVVAREEQGQDAAADRERVASFLERGSQFLITGVDDRNTLLEEMRTELDKATGEEESEIEQRIVVVNDKLEQVLGSLRGQIEKKEALGLDASPERDFLEAFLTDRAALLAGQIAVDQEDLEAAGRLLAASPQDAAGLMVRELTQQRLDRHVASLEAAAELMEFLGLETAEYRQLIFEATGEITTDVLRKDVLGGLLAKWTDSIGAWLVDSGPKLFFQVVLFLLILLIFRFIALIARKIVKKVIQASTLKVSTLLERTALSVTKTVVMIFGFLVALSQVGVEIAPLLAGLGVAGFIVGFALQDTLGNFASGVMILLYRPYDVGDLIEAAGAFGKVSDMSLVSTTILTLDHQTLVIPNNKIWGDVIKNVTAQKRRRVDMVFGISYSDDIPHAESVLEEIVANHEKVLDDPETMIKLHNLGESSVDFVVRPWVLTDDYWDVYWDITREVKIRFDAEGISIPFPQRDVHVFEEKDSGDS